MRCSVNSLTAYKDATLAPTVVLNVDVRKASLCVRDDGTGVLSYEGMTFAFSREYGRFALRRYFEVSDSAPPEDLLHFLWTVFRDEVRCHRLDCSELIPRLRRLAAVDRDQPARFCSIRCQRTEATRRYNAKKRFL